MIKLLGTCVLTLYSVLLLAVEFRTSQDHVRHYVTDITGPVVFYAVNTTLSVFLLWGAALVCFIHTRFPGVAGSRDGLKSFLWSQCLVFAWLGFDDRFQVHERIGYRLNIGDHYVLIAVAIAQLGCLIHYRRFWARCRSSVVFLFAGAGFFTLMLFVDACVPHEMRMRLSVEDLAKTWGTAAFFMFAWELLMQRVRGTSSPGTTQLANTATTSPPSTRSLELVE